MHTHILLLLTATCVAGGSDDTVTLDGLIRQYCDSNRQGNVPPEPIRGPIGPRGHIGAPGPRGVPGERGPVGSPGFVNEPLVREIFLENLEAGELMP